MGALPPEEMERVGRDIEKSPVLQEELRQISVVLEKIAPVDRIGPSQELRGRVLKGITAADEPVVVGSKRKRALQLRSARETASAPSGRTWLMAASLVGILLTSGLAIWLYTQLEETREELAGIEDRMTAAEIAYTRAADELEMLRDNDNHVVRMSPTSDDVQSFAVLYWNPQTRSVWIDAETMPPLPTGEQYQLWALGEEGPVDAGVFDGGTEGLQELKEIEEADGFAVTVEPEGGSETPTLERMTVVGQL